jgi:hypothetical protein
MGVAEHPATDSKMFAFEGDLINTQGYLVKLTNDSFNLSAQMTVPTVGHVRGLLAADLQVVTVGPFMDDDKNTSTLRTRYLVPIPNKYTALFLAHPGGIPPCYYFDTILPVIKADGLGVACNSLTHFCLAAIRVHSAGQKLAVQVAAPRPPPWHIPLLKQLVAILSNFLMGLGWIAAPDVNLQPLINTIVVGTLKDGYVRKVPLPRAPRVQHANSVTHPEHDTCYLIQVPHIPTWRDLTRSLADLGRRTLLPFSPLLV